MQVIKIYWVHLDQGFKSEEIRNSGSSAGSCKIVPEDDLRRKIRSLKSLGSQGKTRAQISSNMNKTASRN